MGYKERIEQLTKEIEVLRQAVREAEDALYAKEAELFAIVEECTREPEDGADWESICRDDGPGEEKGN